MHYRKKDKAKVLSDVIIEMEYHPEDESGKKQMKVLKRLRLRKVCYQDEQNRDYDMKKAVAETLTLLIEDYYLQLNS